MTRQTIWAVAVYILMKQPFCMKKQKKISVVLMLHESNIKDETCWSYFFVVFDMCYARKGHLCSLRAMQALISLRKCAG